MVRCLVGLFVTAVFSVTAVAQEPVRIDYGTLLMSLVDPDWLWFPPPPGTRCVQFSSYDRGSDAGAGAPGWYANDDRGKYLRVVERDGSQEFVMVDVQGPGCVARIWSANPSGVLHFDIDGARVWSVDFAALCSGRVEGVPEPLAGVRSKGGNCHLPIPFGKSLVVSSTAADLYYQVDVVSYPKAWAVDSFTPQLLAAEAKTLDLVRSDLVTLSADASDRAVDEGGGPVRLEPGRVVDDVFVFVQPGPKVEDLGRALQSVRLLVRCGTETTVDVPITDFFCGSEWRPWQSRRLGIGPDLAGYCYWRMPMPDGGSVALVREDPDLDVAFRLEVDHSPLHGENPLLFRANYHLVKGTPTRPFSDHVVLDAKGQGRFVGCSLLVRNPSRIWWGEGDEKFTVDGEAFPSWFGTGTEDYFGYAWCDPTRFQSPFHAQVRCDGPMNFGFTQLHRTHMLDSVPFQESFRFDLERWHWVGDTTIDYATVAYWYGVPGAGSGLPPVPPFAERVLERLSGPPVFVAENALEGEDLRIVGCDAGTHEVQDIGIYERMFSRDKHRWWRNGAPGQALVLAVPVAAAGRYRVTAAFVLANDFGIVQLSLGGQRLGEPVDGYQEQIGSTGPVVLGEVTLPAGDAELRLELTGKNTAAKPSHMVGLDYLRLEAVR